MTQESNQGNIYSVNISATKALHKRSFQSNIHRYTEFDIFDKSHKTDHFETKLFLILSDSTHFKLDYQVISQMNNINYLIAIFRFHFLILALPVFTSS